MEFIFLNRDEINRVITVVANGLHRDTPAKFYLKNGKLQISQNRYNKGIKYYKQNKDILFNNYKSDDQDSLFSLKEEIRTIIRDISYKYNYLHTGWTDRSDVISKEKNEIYDLKNYLIALIIHLQYLSAGFSTSFNSQNNSNPTKATKTINKGYTLLNNSEESVAGGMRRTKYCRNNKKNSKRSKKRRS
jgi:hypothetical protein